MFKSPEGRNRNEGGKKEIGRGERKEEGKKEGKGVKKGCRGSLIRMRRGLANIILGSTVLWYGTCSYEGANAVMRVPILN